MSAIIYLITNTINGKQYVGQTRRGLELRWKEHCNPTPREYICHLHNAIQKYGSESFIIEILEHTTIDDVNAREIYWIKELNTKETGYNMTDGGEGTRGYIPNEQTRAKQSASRTGNKNPNFGKKLSDEVRAKISAAQSGEKSKWYGRKHTNESKAKVSAAKMGELHHYYGKKLSEEHRLKMSEAQKGEKNHFFGKKHSDETRAKMSATRKFRKIMKRVTDIFAPPVLIAIA